MRSLQLALCAAIWLQSATSFQPQSGKRINLRYEDTNADISKEPIASILEEQNQPTLSRRRLFQSVTSVCSSLAILANPFDSDANAAAPITTAEADSFTAKAQRLLRPKPPKALRPNLNRDFAVLLMRSSYNALDELDCVAMDQFQRDFFLIRQAEYEPYVNELGPGIVKQGDLTDPYYFDFISFSQYATINREIFQDPPVVINEQKPIEVPEGEPQKFQPIVVKRQLPDNLLAPTHVKLVGSAILDRLEEIFGASDARLPRFDPKSRPNIDLVLSSVQQLIKYFLINGYAWEGSAFVSRPSSGTDAAGTEITISLVAPANLWSGQALQLRNKATAGGGIQNAFVLTTAKELMSRMGYEVVSSSISYEGTKEVSKFTLR